jgi:hypothetical protein
MRDGAVNHPRCKIEMVFWTYLAVKQPLRCNGATPIPVFAVVAGIMLAEPSFTASTSLYS